MGFLQDISLGQYISRKSLIHNLDPRVKLLSLIFIAIGLIFLKGIFCLICLGILLFATIFFSKIPFSLWSRGFRIFIWFFIIMLIFYGWAGYRSSASIDIFFKLKKGLSLGILASARWAILIGFCFLLTMTTTPSDLTWALQVLLNPLKRLRFPVYDLSIMAGLALHFLPLLKDEADRLVKAKKIQGIAIDLSSFSERIHNIIGLVPILIQRIFHRSEKISMAMEARGFSDKKAIGYETIGLWEPLSRKDLWALTVLVFYLLTIWCISRFFLVGKI